MEESLLERLETLKTEYASGQNMLARLEAKPASLGDTPLPIRGAIQVLEEILAPETELSDN